MKYVVASGEKRGIVVLDATSNVAMAWRPLALMQLNIARRLGGSQPTWDIVRESGPNLNVKNKSY